MSEDTESAIEYLKWSGKYKLAYAVSDIKKIAENLGASNQKLSAAIARINKENIALKARVAELEDKLEFHGIPIPGGASQ